MEEAHRTHKEGSWGWVGVLNEWRRSRTRRVIRAAGRPPLRRGL